jgi:hypothetical protein
MTGPLVDVFLPADKVEEERDKSISSASGAVAAMTGGPRVIVAPGEPATANAAVEAATRYLGAEGPPPQFLMVALPEPAENGDYVGAGPDEQESAVAAALAWLEPAAAGLRAAGADAGAVAFQSPEPAEDLARLAQEWAATDAIVGSDRDAQALEVAGAKVSRVE